jgi:hypothetical protein
VFTPEHLAAAMVAGLKIPSDGPQLRLLDPCVGPATFPKALESLERTHLTIEAFDVDPKMVEASKAFARDSPVNLQVSLHDYLLTSPTQPYDFAILNPPYLRQEWIGNKPQYRARFLEQYGVQVPGTANLYVYFIVKALLELKVGGRLACIVYDSWQSTLYGKWLRNFLALSCSEIEVLPVSSLPFQGRLIDATIVYCTKGSNDDPTPHQVATEFSDLIEGMSAIETLFETKRGLRLKQADFFMSKLERSDLDGGTPFIKKVNLVEGYSVSDSHQETALLLSADNRDSRVETELKTRIHQALTQPEKNISVLTWYRDRPEIWALHAKPPYAPLLFNYYLRHRPRHIFNGARAYSDNFYGCTPRADNVPLFAWLAAMNSTLSAVGLMERARNQGAGLAKLQLYEYRSARVVDLAKWNTRDLLKMERLGAQLSQTIFAEPIIDEIDRLISAVYSDDDIKPEALYWVLEEVSKKAKNPK